VRNSNFAVVAVLLFMSGCGEQRVAAPSLSPAAIAQAALQRYDANHDGFLDQAELEQCPALKSVLQVLDTDGDNRLSSDEISQRIRVYESANLGLMSVACTVYLDNVPLEGAAVRFVPESFMGSTIEPASGVTESNGSALLQAEGTKLPGVRCGFYKVEISKKDTADRELLSPRYNAQTTLGAEVSPDMRGGLRFQLTAKEVKGSPRP
jgi:hypothetical protein